MPELARVEGKFSCPHCGFVVPRLNVQWGAVPQKYVLGDAVRWLRRGGDVLPSYRRVGTETKWNAGTPALDHVLVRDMHEFDPAHEPKCVKCEGSLGGAVVEVRGGRFVGGRLLRPGELPDFPYLAVRADGSVARAEEAEGASVRWEDGPPPDPPS